jgi:hypothetical protein
MSAAIASFLPRQIGGVAGKKDKMTCRALLLSPER